jgi:2-phospho-L-lactate guanylyltransferase
MKYDCWALVPIKARAHCKTRLVSALPGWQRIDIVRRMLDHVLATLRATPAIDRVLVISAERDQIAQDIDVIDDRGNGLNGCLDHGLLIAREANAKHVLVVPADLPLLHGDDVMQLIDAGVRNRFALAPDRHDSGTNGICLDATLPFEFRFGDNSCAVHLQAARDLGLTPARIRTENFAFDLDSERDLALLRELGYFAAA